MVNSEKYSFELKKVQKRANTVESDLKKDNELLAIQEATRKASDVVATTSKLEADAA